MKLHGAPLSQPFRAVVWPCLIKRTPFKLELTIPGAGRNGTLSPSFVEKFPLGTVPVIEDELPGGDAGTLALAESAAILMHLGVTRSWHDLYPEEPRARARLHEYLFWSQLNTRYVAKTLFAPFVRPDLRPSGDEWLRQGKERLGDLSQKLDGVWLQRSPFLAGDHVTIADFSLYEEICPFRFGSLYNFEAHPNLERWMQSMEHLPHHAEVHVVLKRLGRLEDLLDMDAKDVNRTLGSASKEAMKALTTTMSELP